MAARAALSDRIPHLKAMASPAQADDEMLDGRFHALDDPGLGSARTARLIGMARQGDLISAKAV
jgi:hypothetical protein